MYKKLWIVVCLSTLSTMAKATYEWFGEVELGVLSAQYETSLEDTTSPTFGVMFGKAMTDSLSFGAGYTFFQSSEALEADLYPSKVTFHRTISRFGYYGSLGMTYWTSSSLWRESDSGISPLLETGVSYKITDEIMAYLGYRLIPEVGEVFDIQQGVFGLRYQFGQHAQSTLKSLSSTPKEATVISELEITKDIAWALPSFEVDRFSLSPSHHQSLDSLVSALKKGSYENILVIGYTDDTGPIQYNQYLSQRRAESVKQALVNRGLPSSWINTEGRGEFAPKFSNQTSEGRNQNRHVELIIQQFQCDQRCLSSLQI